MITAIGSINNHNDNSDTDNSYVFYYYNDNGTTATKESYNADDNKG